MAHFEILQCTYLLSRSQEFNMSPFTDLVIAVEAEQMERQTLELRKKAL
jgi:hypothetical protein